MTMRDRYIVIRVLIEDPMDLDPAHETGVTNDAYARIIDALSDEGFSVQDITRDY
jgi:hypothetical protein